jgi:hypothetical protein
MASNAAPQSSYCTERDQLQGNLELAASKYSRAAHQLSVTMGSMEGTAYTIARAAADVARRAAEAARNALQRHRKQHGC